MKRSLAPAVIFAIGAHAFAQEETPAVHHVQPPKGSTDSYLYATQPEGKTLPTGMLRVRMPYQISRGSWGFDKDGNKQHIVTATGRGGAIIAEYGLTDKLSLQSRWDYVVSQDVELNRDEFRKTSAFEEGKKAGYNSTFKAYGTINNQAELEEVLTRTLGAEAAKKGLCTGVAICQSEIRTGDLKAPSGGFKSDAVKGFELPEGTPFVAGVKQVGTSADAQISDAVEGIAVDAAHIRGATGGGDLTLGALYEVYAEKPFFFSLAGGIRFPTGKYKSIALDESPTGRGLTEIGLRTNIDLLPIDALMFSWENQAEAQLAKGTVESGDKDLDVERAGIRHKGFVYVKPSLVPLHSSLNVLAPRFGITYDYDSEERIDDLATKRSQIIKQAIGMGLDFTRLDIPVQLDVDYTQPWKGRDVIVATSDLTTTLKLFTVF